MKKYIIILSITLVAIIFIGTFDAKEIAPASEDQLMVTSQTPTIEKKTAIYIARDLDGFIAIFVPDEILPCLMTDINVKTLPLANQEMLKTGIIIDEEYGLAKFIEDYSS